MNEWAKVENKSFTIKIIVNFASDFMQTTNGSEIPCVILNKTVRPL